MNILVISTNLPLPARAGGRVRLHQILSRLGRRHDITLIAPADGPADLEQVGRVRAYCREVIPIPSGRPSGKILRALLRSLLQRIPATALIKYSPELSRRLNDLFTRPFDLAQLEFAPTALYADFIPGRRCPIVLVEHDLAFLSAEQRAGVSRGIRRRFWARESRLMRRWEGALLPRFDRVIAMSERDREKLAILGGEADPAAIPEIDVVPNGVDVAYFSAPDLPKRPDTLFFAGWFGHDPNVDGLAWFLKSVYPAIVRARPGVRLDVVGGAAPGRLRRAAASFPNVRFHGYLEDLRPLLRSATVSIVPIRIGSGTRLKVLEAMAAGTAVVSTAIGAEGLEVERGGHLSIADTERDFAWAVVMLLDRPEFRTAIEKEARYLVERRYGWDAIAARQEAVWEDVVARYRSRVEPGN